MSLSKRVFVQLCAPLRVIFARNKIYQKLNRKIYNLIRVILQSNIFDSMSEFNDYFYLGKVVKLHGYEGKVSIYFDTDEPQEYVDIEVIYMSIAGNLVPYFISELSLLNNKAVVRFLDVDDITTAEGLVNKEIFLPLSLLPELTGNKFYYHEVKGMLVIDEIFGELGPIETVLEYPNQAVLQVFYKSKEVLIPISDEIISKVDRKNNTMTVKTPDGLLDIYLNS